MLEEVRPNIMITDINMPRLDGFGFIKGIREDRRYRAVPILVLSTESDEVKKARARTAGANGWVVKPFDAERLIAAVCDVAA